MSFVRLAEFGGWPAGPHSSLPSSVRVCWMGVLKDPVPCLLRPRKLQGLSIGLGLGVHEQGDTTPEPLHSHVAMQSSHDFEFISIS